MSYCRFGKYSDVYVFASMSSDYTKGPMQVYVSASLQDGDRPKDRFDLAPLDCLDYLDELRKQGLRVPQCAMDRLMKEMSGVT